MTPGRPRTYSSAIVALVGALASSGTSVASVQSYRLDNDMRVVVAPGPHASRAALQLWVAAGAVDDPRERAGLAHLTEHLLAPDEDERGVLGGDYGATTSHDYTVYSMDVEPGGVELAIAALARSVIEIEVGVDDVDRARRTVIEELRTREQDRWWRGIESVYGAAFADHGYSQSILGTVSSLARIRRANVFDFIASRYCGARCTLVASGALEPAQVAELASRGFAGLDRGVARAEDEVGLTQVEDVVVAGRDSRGTHWLGLAGPPVAKPHSAALEVAFEALAASTSAWRGDVELVCCHRLRSATLGVIAMRAESALEAAQRARDAIAQLSDIDIEAARGRLQLAEVLASESADGRATQVANAHIAKRHPLVAGARGYLGPRLAAARGGAPSPAPKGATPARRKRTHAPARAVATATLDNGVRVIVWRRPEVEVVAARIAWTGGALLEPVELGGIHHLMASTVTAGGCGRHTSAGVKQQLDAISGSLEGVVGSNSFGLKGVWLSAGWKTGLELMIECALRPRFDDETFEERRRQVGSVARADADDDATRAHRLAMAALFPGHPYGRSMLGSPATMDQLSSTRLKAFYDQHYPDRPMVLSIVGDVDPDRVLSWARSKLGGLQGLSTQKRVLPAMGPATSGEVYGAAVGQRAHVEVAFRAVGATSADRHVWSVMAAMLDRRGGALYRDLAGGTGLAYDVGAMYVPGLVGGYLAIYANTTPQQAGQVLEAIRKRVAELANGQFEPAQLEAGVETLVGRFQRQLERRTTMSSAFAINHLYGIEPSVMLATPKALRSVAVADVVRSATAMLDWNKAVVATVLPSSRSPEAERRARGVRRRVRRKRRVR